MLTLSGSLRIFLALEPCDMRKSFDSLHALVLSKLGEDPRGGAIFVFTNRTRTLIKLLHRDGTGLWIHAKSHAPQCPHWFVSEDPLPVSSLVRKGSRSFRLRRRRA